MSEWVHEWGNEAEGGYHQLWLICLSGSPNHSQVTPSAEARRSFFKKNLNPLHKSQRYSSEWWGSLHFISQDNQPNWATDREEEGNPGPGSHYCTKSQRWSEKLVISQGDTHVFMWAHTWTCSVHFCLVSVLYIRFHRHVDRCTLTETATLLHVSGMKYKGVLWNFIDFFFRILSRWKNRDVERGWWGEKRRNEKSTRRESKRGGSTAERERTRVRARI